MDPQQQQTCADGQVERSQAWDARLVHGMSTQGEAVSLGPGTGPAHGVSKSVFVLQGHSESGHHHDGSPEEDLEQYPGHEIPAAEHKWPQEASLIISFADPHWSFLNTYPGKGAAG